MSTPICQSHDVIEQMIQLKVQLAHLTTQINTLKPSFYHACHEQNIAQLQREDALIFRKLSPGRWHYPPHILEQEEKVERLKQDFRDTHEPYTGREVIWAIKLSC